MITTDTKAHISELLNTKIVEWKNQGDYTDAELCRRHDLSVSYFNQVKNGSYTDTYPKTAFWAKIAGLVGYQIQRSYWQHFDTRHHENVMAVCHKAHTQQRTFVLDADTGHGKSYSLDYYHKQPSSAGKVYYYRAYDQHESDVDMLRALLKMMRSRKEFKRKSEMTREVIERLNATENCLLIIDEMEFMSSSALKAVRKLVYECEGKIGIILCGAGLSDKLRLLASRKNALRLGWKQFWNRLQWNLKVLAQLGLDAEDPTRSDAWSQTVRQIAKALGIDDDKAIKWLATNASNMRDLRHICEKSLETAEAYGVPVDVRLLTSVTNQVMKS